MRCPIVVRRESSNINHGGLQMIRRDMLVEDLVDEWPDAIPYLIEKGIQAIACGAPIWGTIEEAARQHGYSDAEIDEMIAEMRERKG